MQVSEQFKINYSTAKTLIRFLRMQNLIVDPGSDDQTLNKKETLTAPQLMCGYSLFHP